MLDKLYDSILGDLQAMKSYQRFVEKHALGDSLIELACGSGDLISLLKTRFKRIVGIDLSMTMIEQAKHKVIDPQVNFVTCDMLAYEGLSADVVCCFGDSINYLLFDEQLESFVDQTLRLSNKCILLDCHHLSRIDEFEEGYEEDGIADGIEYSWSLYSQPEHLVHQFIFYTDPVQREEVIQRVYDPKRIAELYLQRGCTVDFYTDFDHPGIAENGEKVFLVVRREI